MHKMSSIPKLPISPKRLKLVRSLQWSWRLSRSRLVRLVPLTDAADEYMRLTDKYAELEKKLAKNGGDKKSN